MIQFETFQGGTEMIGYIVRKTFKPEWLEARRKEAEAQGCTFRPPEPIYLSPSDGGAVRVGWVALEDALAAYEAHVDQVIAAGCATELLKFDVDILRVETSVSVEQKGV